LFYATRKTPPNQAFGHKKSPKQGETTGFIKPVSVSFFIRTITVGTGFTPVQRKSARGLLQKTITADVELHQPPKNIQLCKKTVQTARKKRNLSDIGINPISEKH